MNIAAQFTPEQHHLEIEAAMIDAQRNVALARLRAFEDECFRLGDLARLFGRPAEMPDFLYGVAVANGLVVAHGDGLIHLMIAAGMRGSE